MVLFTPQLLTHLESLGGILHFAAHSTKHDRGLSEIIHSTEHAIGHENFASVFRICRKPSIIIIKITTLLVFIIFFPMAFLPVSIPQLKILYRCSCCDTLTKININLQAHNIICKVINFNFLKFCVKAFQILRVTSSPRTKKHLVQFSQFDFNSWLL